MAKNKFNPYKYFTSKKLPVGYYVSKENIPNRSVSIKSLKGKIFVINCSAEEHLERAFSTQMKKIRKIEKDFGVVCTGGGMWVGGSEYDNDFEFTEETLQNLAAVTGEKI